MKNKKLPRLPQPLKAALKWAFYILFSLILFCFTTSGNAHRSSGLPLLPFCIAVAVFSGELAAAAAGGFCGILIDIAQGQLIGFCGLFLCLFCGLCSALFRQFLRKNLLNYMIALITAAAVYLYLDYFFYYRIWEFEGYQTILTMRLIPSTLKTILISPIMFAAVWLAERISAAKRTLEIEGEDERIDRV